MPKQKQSENEELIQLRLKVFDIEGHTLKIQSANTLLSVYSNEYSPEASIIAAIIDQELKAISDILLK